MSPLGRLMMIFGGLALLAAACSLSTSDEPRIVYITATFPPASGETIATPFLPSPPPPSNNTTTIAAAREHIVQPNDTLYGIALAYGVSLDSILAVNEFDDPNTLFVGQRVRLPDLPTEQTPDFRIISDHRLVRGPGSAAFSVADFVNQQPGYIRLATDAVETRQADGSTREETLAAAEIVERVSMEFSVDPRLLLALLEYRAGWLSNPQPDEDLRTHPMISDADSGERDREGLYRQLTWTADRLNMGYYGWVYRGWTTLEFADGGPRLLYQPGLNAGTVAVQYFLSLFNDDTTWQREVSRDGFYQVYVRYFGDPFEGVLDPLVPAGLQQPEMALPFVQGEVWFFTGGWHGGWGSGSAWAAVDFAPPDDRTDGVVCYTSDYWVTAVAPGVIARSGDGVVVLDLDGDGDETTGWTVLYLHLSERVEAGTRVEAGSPLGRASCEGGFSTATHLHIGRRYNGEWIPAQCIACDDPALRPTFNLGGWSVVGIRNQEYQGYLDNNGERRVAEQGRLSLDNRISW